MMLLFFSTQASTLLCKSSKMLNFMFTVTCFNRSSPASLQVVFTNAFPTMSKNQEQLSWHFNCTYCSAAIYQFTDCRRCLLPLPGVLLAVADDSTAAKSPETNTVHYERMRLRAAARQHNVYVGCHAWCRKT